MDTFIHLSCTWLPLLYFIELSLEVYVSTLLYRYILPRSRVHWARAFVKGVGPGRRQRAWLGSCCVGRVEDAIAEIAVGRSNRRETWSLGRS